MLNSEALNTLGKTFFVSVNFLSSPTQSMAFNLDCSQSISSLVTSVAFLDVYISMISIIIIILVSRFLLRKNKPYFDSFVVIYAIWV